MDYLDGAEVAEDPREQGQSGFKSGAAEWVTDFLRLDTHLIRTPEGKELWQVKGDGLRRDGLKHGDKLIVDRHLVPGPGDWIVTAAGRVEEWRPGARARGVVRWVVRETARGR